jgi:hypothetical protein
MMRRKREMPTEDTRTVIVRVFARRVVSYFGDVVVAVPAELTDEEVQAMAWENADSLPEPACWEEMDDDEDIEMDTDACPVVRASGRNRNDVDAQLIVIGDGEGEILT